MGWCVLGDGTKCSCTMRLLQHISGWAAYVRPSVARKHAGCFLWTLCVPGCVASNLPGHQGVTGCVLESGCAQHLLASDSEVSLQRLLLCCK